MGEDKKRYAKMAEECKKKYDIDMAAYKEGNYNPVQNEPVNDKSMELNSTLNEKKKKKDKKRPRSPSPEIAKKSPSSSPVKESKAVDEPVTSPAKKKSRKNISFETSTPIRLEENNHTKNNNDCSINDEQKKKKSKKKDKDKEDKDKTGMANSLIDNLKKKYNK